MFKLAILLSYKSHVIKKNIYIFSKFKLKPQLPIEASFFNWKPQLTIKTLIIFLL